MDLHNGMMDEGELVVLRICFEKIESPKTFIASTHARIFFTNFYSTSSMDI